MREGFVEFVEVVAVVAAHDEDGSVDELGEFVGVEGLGSAQLPVDQLVDLIEFVDPLDQGVQFRCGRREFGLGDAHASPPLRVKASSSAGSYLSSRGPTRRLVNRPSAT